jgi:hypothetical protein
VKRGERKIGKEKWVFPLFGWSEKGDVRKWWAASFPPGPIILFPFNLERNTEGKWHVEDNYKITLHFSSYHIYNKNMTLIFFYFLFLITLGV